MLLYLLKMEHLIYIFSTIYSFCNTTCVIEEMYAYIDISIAL